jgi:hypothetical protein
VALDLLDHDQDLMSCRTMRTQRPRGRGRDMVDWQVDGNVTIATTRLSRRTIGLSDVD